MPIEFEQIPIGLRGRVDPPSPEHVSTFGETVGAQFRDSWFVNAVGRSAYNHSEDEPVDGYVSLRDPMAKPWIDMGYGESFMPSRSPATTARVIEQIKGELRDKEIMAHAGFFKNLGAGITLLPTDPMNLLPATTMVRGALKAGSIFKAGLAVARDVASITTVQEAILHSQQITRTKAESLQTIAGSAVLGFGLGSFGGALGKMGVLRGKAEVALVEALDTNLKKRVEATGKTLVEMAEPERQEIFAQAMADTGAERAKLKGMNNPVARAMLKFGIGWNDTGVALTSPSRSMVELGDKIIQHHMVVDRIDELQQTAAQTERTQWKHYGDRHALYQQRNLQEYLRQPEAKLSQKDFLEEIIFSLRDPTRMEALEPAERKHIAPAVEQFRRLDDQLADEAIKLDLLDEKSLKNHVLRVFDQDALMQDAEGAQAVISRWLHEEQGLTDAAEIKRHAVDVYDAILRSPGGVLSRKWKPKSGPLMERTIEIPDYVFDGSRYADESGKSTRFIHNDPIEIMQRTVDAISTRLAVVRRTKVDTPFMAGIDADLSGLVKMLESGDAAAGQLARHRLDAYRMAYELYSTPGARNKELAMGILNHQKLMEVIDLQANKVAREAATTATAQLRKRIDDLRGNKAAEKELLDSLRTTRREALSVLAEKRQALKAAREAMHNLVGPEMPAQEFVNVEAAQKAVTDLQYAVSDARVNFKHAVLSERLAVKHTSAAVRELAEDSDEFTSLVNAIAIHGDKSTAREFAETAAKIAEFRKQAATLRSTIKRLTKESPLAVRGRVTKLSPSTARGPKSAVKEAKRIKDAIYDLKHHVAEDAYSLRPWRSRVEAEHKELINAMTPGSRKQRNAIKRMEKDLRVIDRMVPTMSGKAFLLGNNPRWAFTASRTAGRLTHIVKSGMFLIPSIIDAAQQVGVNGARETMRGLGKLLRRTLEGDPLLSKNRDELMDLAIAAHKTADATATRISADLFDEGTNLNWLDRTTGRLTSWANKLNGTYYFNMAHAGWSTATTQSRMIRDMAKWVDGKLTVSELQNLQIGRVSKKLASYVKERIDDGTIENDEGLLVARTDKWADREMADAFEQAVLGDVDRIVLRPTAFDTPVFAQHPLGKLIFMFQSYAMAANQKILVAGLQRHDARVAGGVLAALSLATFGVVIRNYLEGKEHKEHKDTPTLAAQIFDASGLLAMPMMVNNVFEQTLGLGLRPAIGAESRLGPRAGNDSIAEAVGGAPLGYMDQLRRSAQIVGAWASGDIPSRGEGHTLRTAIPYNGAIIIREFFDAIENKVGDVYNFTGKRRAQ